MSKNGSIRNKRKLLEELRGFTYKITYLSTANYAKDCKTWYQIGTKFKLWHFFDQND